MASTIQRSIDGEAVALIKIGDLLGDLAVNLAIALLIFLLTLWLAGRAATLARRTIQALPRTQDDMTLQSFASSAARMVVIIIGLVAVLRRLGVETTSIVAVLGAASLAIGLALQGALSNVAAGLMILLFRPYRVGDVVTIAGRTGLVKRLDLISTELIDGDGLKVIAPNGKAFGDIIVNATDIPRRRIELNFGVDYGDDLAMATKIALEVARKDPRILQEPAPWAKVTGLAASSVTVTLRVWTLPADHAETTPDLVQGIKQAFDGAGIRFPFPTQETIERRIEAPEPPAPAPRS